MKNANKSPKISYSAIMKKMKKVVRNPHVDLDHHQKSLLEGHSLPTPAKAKM